MSDFANRMKQYESHATQRQLIQGLPVYIRIDGRAFSDFTRKMDRPFDARMIEAMVDTTKALVQETDALVGYTQSDEINLVLYTDNRISQGYFEGKIFKINSVLASFTSSVFLLNYIHKFGVDPNAIETPPAFDCRVLNLPSKTETANMLLWRELDATRNAIISAARSVYTQKEIHRKNGSELQEMLFQKGINFNEYPAFFKRGTFVRKIEVEKELEQNIWDKIPEVNKPPSRTVKRREIVTIDMPPFSKVTNREAVIFEGATPICEGATPICEGATPICEGATPICEGATP